jgi:hypothetical protein
MSPILRHFSQDEVGDVQKNAINWGFFDMLFKTPGFSGFFDAQKQTGRGGNPSRPVESVLFDT